MLLALSDKKQLLEKKLTKYKSLNPSKTEALLEKQAMSYKEMSISEKETSRT